MTTEREDDTRNFDTFNLTTKTISKISLSRSQQAWMIGAVLTMTIWPYLSIAGTAYAYQFLPPDIASEIWQHFGHYVFAIQVSIPLLALVALSPLTWESVGLMKPRPIMDFQLAIPAFVIGMLGSWGATMLLPGASRQHISLVEDMVFPDSTVGWVVMLLASVASGFMIPFAFYGVLLTRLEQAINGTLIAAIVAAAANACCYSNNGVEDMLSVFGEGLVYGLLFCMFRRIWPLVIASSVVTMMTYCNVVS